MPAKGGTQKMTTPGPYIMIAAIRSAKEAHNTRGEHQNTRRKAAEKENRPPIQAKMSDRWPKWEAKTRDVSAAILVSWARKS